MIWIDWKYSAQIPLTEQNKTYTPAEIFSPQPQGGVCRKAHVSRMDFNKKDNSATDFAYALALARRGYGDDYIKERIVSERTNWKNHYSDRKRNLYLDRTITKIRAIIQNS